jgi:hypothetical protein
VRSIISEEIFDLLSLTNCGFVFVDECRDDMALALARNNGQRVRICPSGSSESESDEISMTFINFFAIGLEGEGETIRVRSVNRFRGDFFEKSPRPGSPDESALSPDLLLEGERGTSLSALRDVGKGGLFVIIEEECDTGKNDFMLPCIVEVAVCFLFFVRSLIPVRGLTEVEEISLTRCLLDPA